MTAPSSLRIVKNSLTLNVQFIVDYDDTLIPTTLYANCGRNRKILSGKIDLKEFDNCLYEFLSLLKSIGSVTIITGSENGWTVLSGSDICPRSNQLLSSFPTIALGIRQGDNDAVKKKYDAMLSCINKDTDIIISIGDSEIELEAASKLRKKLQNKPKVLTVKMKVFPNGNELINSLKYLYYCIRHQIIAGFDLIL